MTLISDRNYFKLISNSATYLNANIQAVLIHLFVKRRLIFLISPFIFKEKSKYSFFRIFN